MAGDRSFSRYDSAPTSVVGGRRSRPSASDPVLLDLVARFPGRWAAIAKMSGYPEVDLRSVFHRPAGSAVVPMAPGPGKAPAAPQEPGPPPRKPNRLRDSVQGRALRAIRDVVRRSGKTALPQQVGAVLNLEPREVHAHVAALRHKGWVESGGAYRGWRVTPAGEATLKLWDELT